MIIVIRYYKCGWRQQTNTVWNLLLLDSERTIFMAFVHGNHFVQLIMHSNCPLPPLFTSWKRYRMDITANWNLDC